MPNPLPQDQPVVFALIVRMITGRRDEPGEEEVGTPLQQEMPLKTLQNAQVSDNVACWRLLTDQMQWIRNIILADDSSLLPRDATRSLNEELHYVHNTISRCSFMPYIQITFYLLLVLFFPGSCVLHVTITN